MLMNLIITFFNQITRSVYFISLVPTFILEWGKEEDSFLNFQPNLLKAFFNKLHPKPTSIC